jgi:hypothetical protein
MIIQKLTEPKPNLFNQVHIVSNVSAINHAGFSPPGEAKPLIVRRST